MTLLDRFRAQPRRKHPDAAVRLAFVQEVPLSERDLLIEMAREDVDPRVRRAAVSKLMDPAALGVVAKNDADEAVRAQATSMLRDVALEAFEGVAEVDSLTAVDALAGLGDIKNLATVAKIAPRLAVADRARSRVSDARTLGSIARHSEHEPVRREALGALTDPREILSVALNSEFREPTISAVEQITDRDALEQIATRAKNRSAAKRARAITREIDERRARERDAPAAVKAAPMGGTSAVDRTAPIESRESSDPAAQAGPPGLIPGAPLASAAPFEHGVEPRAVEPEPESTEPRSTEGGSAEGESVEHGSFQPLVDVGRDGDAERRAVLRGDDIARTQAARPLATAPGQLIPRLVDRERKAERERERRESAEKEAERNRTRLAELAEEAVRVAALEDLSAARRQMTVLRREWSDLTGRVAAEPAVSARYSEADAAFNARDAAAREADQKNRRAALAKLQQLAARLEPLVSRDDLTIKLGDRALRDIRTALSAVPPLPSRQDYEEIVRRLKAVQVALTPKVQELREVAGWQRWANVGIQEQLCEKMEALKTLDAPEEIARQVKELQLQWRQAADVPRAQGELLWKRFKTAHDEAWARCEAYFAAQAGLRSENLAKKTALCERAEALADSSNWIQTADAIKKLQAEWKSIGPVSRGQEKMIWDRFRAACDRFFTRRHADLTERKKVWSENLTKKEALIAKVEALAESTDWDNAAAEIKRLQAEWKTIGPVKKSRSETLWLRFRAGCDQFFTRYAQRFDIARAERVAARESLVAELETLAGIPSAVAGETPSAAPEAGQTAPQHGEESVPGGQETPAAAGEQGSVESAEAVPPPPDLLAKVRDLRRRWDQELAARGVDRERARELDERFAAAFRHATTRWPSAFAGTDLDPDANRKRMEALVRRIEELANSLAGPHDAGATDAALSPATRLATLLKESWAANTIGGKADNESRLRAAQDEVRQAQSSWSRIGPVPEAARRALSDRFQTAIRRITERANPHRLVGARR